MFSFAYSRRKAHTVSIGSLLMGSDYPVVAQSMTTASTDDTLGCVEQIRLVEQAGGSLVRLTAASRHQALNLEQIHAAARNEGLKVPLCADIHFNSNLALLAARFVEKVRINPGNYGTLLNFRKKFVELLDLCKSNGCAIRIGVNHGSLSPEIMELYGNTPLGMVQSALQYLRVCKEERFGNAVVSLKSSNPRVMVESYRLAVRMMEEEGFDYPLHLGVTEAGEGESGRIRSAVGIGALLADGIGDTIRVSLTEPPQNEIPVAQSLIAHYEDLEQRQTPIDVSCDLSFDLYSYKRRKPDVVPIVVGKGGDYEAVPTSWFQVCLADLTPLFIENIKGSRGAKIVLKSDNRNWVGEIRAMISVLVSAGVENDFVLYKDYMSDEDVALYGAADMGAVLIDGIAEGVWLERDGEMVDARIGLEILQAARLRISTTEIISCPGCGRTQYDISTVVRAVKSRFSDRAGLKIAVMGCVVNGPGEMADADYGYIGGAKGEVSLYRGRELVERNVSESEALDRLELLIEEGR